MGGLSISEQALRVVFFAVNVGFSIIGMLFIVIGSQAITSVRELKDFDVQYVINVSGLLIAIGCLIFIIGFFGCTGSLLQKYWMLMTFCMIVIVIFCCEMVLCFYAYKNSDAAIQILDHSMNKSMAHYQEDETTKKTWKSVQGNFKCCGTNGPGSWSQEMNIGNVPDSCCITEVEGCGLNYFEDEVFQSGCVKKVEDLVSDNIMTIVLIAVIMGMFHWFGVLMACCLGNAFKHYERID